MDKLEAVQKVLRFSQTIREKCEKEHSTYFDDFDNENIEEYEEGGLGDLADLIIEGGIEEGFLDDEDLRDIA